MQFKGKSCFGIHLNASKMAIFTQTYDVVKLMDFSP